MWNYEKRLQYPVKITRCDPKAAMIIASQYGGLYSDSSKLFLGKLNYTKYFLFIYPILPFFSTFAYHLIDDRNNTLTDALLATRKYCFFFFMSCHKINPTGRLTLAFHVSLNIIGVPYFLFSFVVVLPHLDMYRCGVSTRLFQSPPHARPTALDFAILATFSLNWYHIISWNR